MQKVSVVTLGRPKDQSAFEDMNNKFSYDSRIIQRNCTVHQTPETYHIKLIP